MNYHRTGKIARLPALIREELNQRLQDGAQGPELVEWLNSLTEVQDLMDSEFEGKPVREQNLSEWRKGGYVEWLSKCEALGAVHDFQTEAGILHLGAAKEPLAGKMSLWLMARYLVAAQKMTDGEGNPNWKMMREFCRDVVAVRRGDHMDRRLQLVAERQCVQERFTIKRWHRSVINAMESLEQYVKKHPKAKRAFQVLVNEITTENDKLIDKCDAHPAGETNAAP